MLFVVISREPSKLHLWQMSKMFIFLSNKYKNATQKVFIFTETRCVFYYVTEAYNLVEVCNTCYNATLTYKPLTRFYRKKWN